MKRFNWTQLATVVAMLIALPAVADDLDKPNIGGLDRAGGVIKGKVLWMNSRTPAPKQIKVAADPFCIKAAQKKPIFEERYLFGKNGDKATLINTLVYVSKGHEGEKFDTPKKPTVIDQVDCKYIPHVNIAMVNQPIKIKNSDATLHNVFCVPANNPGFNDGMPIKGQVLDKKFGSAELGIRLSCSVHAWMQSIVHVVDNPFAAITGEDGTFELRGLKDGTYTVSVWHEFKRFAPKSATATVTIKDGKADKPIVFEYDLKR